MSITVTAATTPKPRFTISVSSSDGSPITAIQLIRVVAGGSEPTRQQPTVGPSPRLVNDYAADWDVNVVYRAIVTSSAGTETFVSDPLILSPAVPWAIHPTVPALSVPLDQATTNALGIREHGQITRAATDTPHNVLGSATRVYTKTGPRAASTTSLTVIAVTADEVQALLAIINDLTPLLIRVPAVWGWQWEAGYYRVGDVSIDRQVQYGADNRRIFTLPLERVESPAGSLQAERTYATVLNQFATYAAARAAYKTYTDAVADVRS